MPLGVQDSHAESEKSHKKKIREDDLVERDGQLKFFWNLNESGCNDPDQNRGEENPEER